MSGVQDVDERIERLQELIHRCQEEIARLQVRKTRALHIIHEQLLATAPDEDVRAWAVSTGRHVGRRGRVPGALREDYLRARAGGSVVRTEEASAHPSEVGATGRPGTDHRAPNEPSGAPMESTPLGAPAHA